MDASGRSHGVAFFSITAKSCRRPSCKDLGAPPDENVDKMSLITFLTTSCPSSNLWLALLSIAVATARKESTRDRHFNTVIVESTLFINSDNSMPPSEEVANAVT